MSFKILKEDGSGAILAENGNGLKIEMTEKTIVGDEYWHVFESNSAPGTFVNQPCTQVEYEALSVSGFTIPTLNGHTYRYSFSDWEYDTPSGRLEDGCYVVSGGKYFAKLPNKAQESVDAI